MKPLNIEKKVTEVECNSAPGHKFQVLWTHLQV